VGAPDAANRPRTLVSRFFTFRAGQRLVPPTANPWSELRSRRRKPRGITSYIVFRTWPCTARSVLFRCYQGPTDDRTTDGAPAPKCLINLCCKLRLFSKRPFCLDLGI